MISEKVYKLCTEPESVSSLLAQNPTLAPEEAWKKLYGHHLEKDSKATAKAHRDRATPEDLQRAAACGKWGPTQPSELFLRMYHDALCTLDNSVSGCMVSPSLMGSCGTVPLTVISVVPLIMKHMANLIVRADKEVFLATNYWINSVASKYITDAMKELSRRAGERGEKIVFKMLYDRGSPKQLLEPHYFVAEKEYLGKAVNLPKPEEIPNLDLQVMNYHKPMLGTFHCKYMVVDRKFAVLQSNNIQDNDNMEMMIHLEGPIVDSLYDVALLSWAKKFDPPLPSYNSPAVQGGLGSFADGSHNDVFGPDGALRGHTAVVDPSRMQQKQAYDYPRRQQVAQPGMVANNTNTGMNDASKADVLTGPSTTESILHPMNQQSNQQSRTGQGQDNNNQTSQNLSNTDQPSYAGQGQGQGQGQGFSGQTTHHYSNTSQQPFTGQGLNFAGQTNQDFSNTNQQSHVGQGQDPTGQTTQNLANMNISSEQSSHQMPQERSGPIGVMNGNSSSQAGAHQQVHSSGSGTQAPGADARTQEFLYSGEQAIPQSQIENPIEDGEDLPEFTTDHVVYDKDIAGEVARIQQSVSPKNGESRMEAVSRVLNHTKNPGFKGEAPACEPTEEMTPYIPHPVHDPFPIAMVCREPFGSPSHSSVYNPQNEVWLSALRNAQKNVFIQSPTLNAEPLVPAIVEACERGIDVYCYICLGYNDTGELLPKQGGTNEMIAHKLFTTLSPHAKKNLHWFWYIGKDQVKPIVAKKKKRDCHIKVMIVDEHIGIQGNGNQDTQSWYHSQEINVMLDSAMVCRAWIDGLRRNQNTHLYGEVSQEDGIWRDANGNQAEDVIGVDPGRFSWAKGFMGAIKRVQGTGDF